MLVLERFSAALIAGFAAWTIFLHALTFTECSFETLREWSWLGLLGAVVAAGFAAKLGSPRRSIRDEEVLNGAYDKKIAISGIVGALVLILVYRWTASYLIFWFLAVAYLVIARWVLGAGPVHVSSTRVEEALHPAIAIAACCVAIYSISRAGINLDDPFQVNLIVGLLEHPSWPVFRFDTMHRIADLP